tara:strand:- start:536 stop:700 length:165 start_codon:yes stop_codon:yes gene_type:complete
MSEASILRKEINKLKRCIREKNKIISNLQSEKESNDYYCLFQRTSEALKHSKLN